MSNYLILRPKKDAAKTLQTLENQGHSVLLEPIFNVENFPINIKYNSSQKIIITSANACNAIISAHAPKNITIFAIGRKTAQNLVEQGYQNIFYSDFANAQSLKKLVLQKCNPNDEILYFCGDTITLDFKKELEYHGLKVQKILAYQINWHENFSENFLHEISCRKIDFVLIYSQKSLQNFFYLITNHNIAEIFLDLPILCLSAKIEDLARNMGFKKTGKI